MSKGVFILCNFKTVILVLINLSSLVVDVIKIANTEYGRYSKIEYVRSLELVPSIFSPLCDLYSGRITIHRFKLKQTNKE